MTQVRILVSAVLGPPGSMPARRSLKQQRELVDELAHRRPPMRALRLLAGAELRKGLRAAVDPKVRVVAKPAGPPPRDLNLTKAAALDAQAVVAQVHAPVGQGEVDGPSADVTDREHAHVVGRRSLEPPLAELRDELGVVAVVVAV